MLDKLNLSSKTTWSIRPLWLCSRGGLIKQGTLYTAKFKQFKLMITGCLVHNCDVYYLQQNMAELLARQQKAKYYQQVKDGRYRRLCRTDAALDSELQKQIDRMQNMTAILERLSQEYPHVQPGLRKVMLVFGSRSTSIEGGD